MLALSLALHLTLALGVVSTFFYSHSSLKTSPDETKTTLTLVPSEVSTSLPQSASVHAPAYSGTTNPSQLASSLPTAKKNDAGVETGELSSQATSTPTSEANPNANVPQPKSDSLLCPVPPPVLNSKDAVVFVLDISGSMYEPYSGSTRLTFARQALSRCIHALKNGKPFAIVIYAQTGRRSGPLVAASDATREAAVRFIMEDFNCGGGTNLSAGLTTAQELHPGHIVIASDGDLNVSPRDLLTDADRILNSENHSPALTIIGVGPRPNTNAESILQSLAEQQEGSYLAAELESSSKLLTANKTEVNIP